MLAKATIVKRCEAVQSWVRQVIRTGTPRDEPIQLPPEQFAYR